MNPLISVIVPIYNVEAYLPRCLDSIVNQTYQNLEIILVDDGSPDNCGTICDEYANRDSRIRVIHKENGGVSSARNAGLDVMQGDYLTFVDPDDWLSLDAVQVLYDRLVEDGSDMAIGRHTDVYPDGRENGAFCQWMVDQCCTAREYISRKTDRHYIIVSACGKLYKSEVYRELRFPKLNYAEDMMIFLSVMDRVSKISLSGKLIYFYFQRENSKMHVMNDEARRDCLRANLLVLKYLMEKGSLYGINMWFERCIEQAYRMENNTEGYEIFLEILGKRTSKKLRRNQNLKNQIKWDVLRHPCFAAAVRTGKACLGR
jgi:glycosyltransferase involved in cell wall biosynthesis